MIVETRDQAKAWLSVAHYLTSEAVNHLKSVSEQHNDWLRAYEEARQAENHLKHAIDWLKEED